MPKKKEKIKYKTFFVMVECKNCGFKKKTKFIRRKVGGFLLDGLLALICPKCRYLIDYETQKDIENMVEEKFRLR